ncbi:MAG: alpha/beta fold hydrolase [Proteobacteria bacterium]|nr:alpha/beta fold hydrolase [Pseudomonadota bacterium]
MTSTAHSPLAGQDTAEDRYAQLGGVRLRYRDEGAGPALLLVHGWTLDLQMWEPQVAAWRAEFRVVRLDRRGHGLSGGTPDTARDAADLAGLCVHLGLRRVALVGMSQGVRGVLALASGAPERVSAMILDGPPSLETAESDDVPLGRFQALARAGGMAAFRREWASLPLMQLRTRDARTRQSLAAMLERYPGHELLADLPAAPPTPLPLERLQVPALVLVGEHDTPGRAQAARALCRRLPNAQFATIAEAGHLPNLDQPARYSAVCRSFLLRHAVHD